VSLSLKSFGQSKKFLIHTVAFYNFENLFDTINDPNTFDEDWTPKGSQHWTFDKYQNKLTHLARVLAEIGSSENPESPTFIGGCEIENRGVLEDLIQQPNLADKTYGIIHFDSPDKRGIDVALLYRKNFFQPTSYANIPLYVFQGEAKPKNETTECTDDMEIVSPKNKRVYTRDQRSSPFREAAGALNRKIMDSLQQINPNAKVITMGDLNDGPYNKSVKIALGAKAKKRETLQFGIFNPFGEMQKRGMGTIAHRDAWDIFDQIMVSESLLKNEYSSWQFWKAGIYNKSFLIQKSGSFKGYPLRHSATEIGFSDHFPVYIYLIKEKN
jgi:hypothetical protein